MTWVYYSDGTLAIEGIGEIAEFGECGWNQDDISGDSYFGYWMSEDQPWYDYRKEIRTVTIGSGVTSVGVGAFYDCFNLERVTIGGGVTSIDVGAFSGCTRLTSVTLGDSVTYIDKYAFEDCDSLTDVYYGGSESQWEQIKIDIWDNGNDPLLNATIHYNS